MSYEIVYDRRFIKVGDKYVPMICQGSSNGYEIVFGGREVAEKNFLYCAIRVKRTFCMTQTA